MTAMTKKMPMIIMAIGDNGSLLAKGRGRVYIYAENDLRSNEKRANLGPPPMPVSIAPSHRATELDSMPAHIT